MFYVYAKARLGKLQMAIWSVPQVLISIATQGRLASDTDGIQLPRAASGGGVFKGRPVRDNARR